MDMSGMLTGIAAACAANQDDDTHIGEDGLKHCNRCGGRREFVRDFSGTEGFQSLGTFRVACSCECMLRADAEKRAAEQREAELRAINDMRIKAFGGSEMINCTFDTDDGKNARLSEAMRRYCQHFDTFRKDGKGLMLYGGVGTGKSFYAACIVNDLIGRGHVCMMTTMSSLTNRMSESFQGRQDFIDSLAEYDLIAIDDLGVERDTAYMNENVTVIIDTLYRNRTPMIITSNMSTNDMRSCNDIVKSRIYDRIVERCYFIKVEGESRRRSIARNDSSDMRDILGV